jgi:hypothetical protein
LKKSANSFYYHHFLILAKTSDKQTGFTNLLCQGATRLRSSFHLTVDGLFDSNGFSSGQPDPDPDPDSDPDPGFHRRSKTLKAVRDAKLTVVGPRIGFD